MGVPQIWSYLSLPYMSALHANPKSPILSFFPLIKIFSGFTSRCMHEFYTKILNPSMIPLNISMHYAYLNF